MRIWNNLLIALGWSAVVLLCFIKKYSPFFNWAALLGALYFFIRALYYFLLQSKRGRAILRKFPIKAIRNSAQEPT